MYHKGMILVPKHIRVFSSAVGNVSIATKVKARYYIPREDRSSNNEMIKRHPIFKDRQVKVSRQCPTRDLNYDTKAWERHKSPYRRLRHLLTIFNSSPFRRLIFPELTLTASVGVGLAYYNEIIAKSPIDQLYVDGPAMAGATTAIGLLTAFRLNASYGRYEEARKFWGEINNASRDLAGNSFMWLESSESKKRMLKLIQAFPVSMQWHLNEKGGHYQLRRKDPDFEEQKYANFVLEMQDIYRNDKDPDFIQICSTFRNGEHVPLSITADMRFIISQNSPNRNHMYNRQMDEQVSKLVGCLGMCERVLRTPIPVSFTRHTSRLIFLWSNMLPFTMYSTLGPFSTIPASLIVSYAIVAIADIGVQLEEPFNILPLRQYSEGIFDGVNAIETSFIRNHQRFRDAEG